MGLGAGPWYIDDNLTFTVDTHNVATGAGSDADAVPSYRIYEDETATPILTGSMALLDSANTVGLYSEQIALSAANGFEVGKSYTVYVSATVNSVTATQSFNFKVTAINAPVMNGGHLVLRQSTASQEVVIGPLINPVTGAAATALTIANTDIKIWKNGATTLANKNSGGATHISNGNYYATFDATDSDTVAAGKIIIQVAGAQPFICSFDVLPAAVYDAIYGTSNLAVDVVKWNGTAVPAEDTAGCPKVTIKDGTGTGELDTLNGAVLLRPTGLDAITPAEPAAVPAFSSATLPAMIAWLLTLGRNKITQTATTQTVRNNADSATIATAPVSDDGTTATRGKFV